MTTGQQLDVRIYFEDTDAGGVVFYANYLRFYERARTEFLRAHGFEQDQLMQQNTVFVVRSAAIDFIQAVRFNQQLRIHSTIEQIKKASLVFRQSSYLLVDGLMQPDPVNAATVKLACVCADSFKPRAIPAPILEKLTNE